MNNFNYIAVFDLDEIILPAKPPLSIPAMLDKFRAGRKRTDTFRFNSLYFPDLRERDNRTRYVDGRL